MKKAITLLTILALGSPILAGVTDLIPEGSPLTPIRTISVNVDGKHVVGRIGARGWQVDYSRDKPGYVLSGLRDPLILEPGFYRATFFLRRGHYPDKGLLFKTYGLFRLEIWDVTANKIIEQRELQIDDFTNPNSYDPRWIEFSMRGRDGHLVEPRIYWIGLGNGEAASVQIDRFPDVVLHELETKARRLGEMIELGQLENGFVVSREVDGTADETGDATTYTGFYVASLAWRYAATGDSHAYQALENGLATLHNAIKGTAEEPILTRFVDEEGVPFPKAPSKDVYTAFFLAYGAAYPHITNEALRKQMRRDASRLARKFLRDGLAIKGGKHTLVSLTPYFTDEEVQSGIQKLFADKKDLRKITRALKTSRRVLPFGELWPGMVQVIKAMEHQNEKQLFSLVPITLDGVFGLSERVRDILREQYRQDLFPKRYTNKEYPGIKLADTLTLFLKRFPKSDDGKRIHHLAQLRILASNALISLHIIKTAATLTNESTFKEYYQSNLYKQDELLKTALDWYGVEDELVRLVAGNTAANKERRGYLGTLALMSLISQEENPSIKEKYESVLKKEWALYKHEDNPLMAVLATQYLEENQMDQVLRSLSLYPENRVGFGPSFWKENGKDIAKQWGGGEEDGFSREPLPVSLRPKDSFLWQRNARRLSGDWVRTYPSTDYLFIYWFARANGMIEETPAKSTAKK